MGFATQPCRSRSDSRPMTQMGGGERAHSGWVIGGPFTDDGPTSSRIGWTARSSLRFADPSVGGGLGRQHHVNKLLLHNDRPRMDDRWPERCGGGRSVPRSPRTVCPPRGWGSGHDRDDPRIRRPVRFGPPPEGLPPTVEGTLACRSGSPRPRNRLSAKKHPGVEPVMLLHDQHCGRESDG